jgi:hypothetical protein
MNSTKLIAQNPFAYGLVRLGKEAALFRRGEKVIDPKAYANCIRKIDAYITNAKVSFPEYFQEDLEELEYAG